SGHPAALEPRAAGGPSRRVGVDTLERTPGDQLDELGVVDAGRLCRRDRTTVAEDGDPLREAEPLVQPVADEEHALSRSGVAAQRAQQQLDVGVRQRGRRLVEDEDAAVPALLILE